MSELDAGPPPETARTPPRRRRCGHAASRPRPRSARPNREATWTRPCDGRDETAETGVLTEADAASAGRPCSRPGPEDGRRCTEVSTADDRGRDRSTTPADEPGRAPAPGPSGGSSPRPCARPASGTRSPCLANRSSALLDALGDAGIRVVAARHEGGAAFMAEAHGQLTGRPAACLATRAVGGRNLAIGDPHGTAGLEPDVRAGRTGRARVPWSRGVPGDRPGRDARWPRQMGRRAPPRRGRPGGHGPGRPRGTDRPARTGAGVAAGGPARRGRELEPADVGRPAPARATPDEIRRSSSCSPRPDGRSSWPGPASCVPGPRPSSPGSPNCSTSRSSRPGDGPTSSRTTIRSTSGWPVSGHRRRSGGASRSPMRSS